MTYYVRVTDRAGTASETSCTDFAHCLQVFRLKSTRYPDTRTHVVDAFNTSRSDYDTNGLTEAEREQLAEVEGT